MDLLLLPFLAPFYNGPGTSGSFTTYLDDTRNPPSPSPTPQLMPSIQSGGSARRSCGIAAAAVGLGLSLSRALLLLFLLVWALLLVALVLTEEVEKAGNDLASAMKRRLRQTRGVGV